MSAKATPAPLLTRSERAPPGLLWVGAAPLAAAVPVPLSCSATLLNAVKLRAELSTALIAKTIPAPQWLKGVFWAQYAQIGAVSFTVMFQLGKSVVTLSATAMKPELKPGAADALLMLRGLQGSAKEL
jgi:hypothetical protein